MGGDMMGKSPMGDHYENLGSKHYFAGEDCISCFRIFSGFGSLVLDFW
jgi:hypothetical protein